MFFYHLRHHPQRRLRLFFVFVHTLLVWRQCPDQRPIHHRSPGEEIKRSLGVDDDSQVFWRVECFLKWHVVGIPRVLDR